MAKKQGRVQYRGNIAAGADLEPRLGTVLRFAPGGAMQGIKRLETGGFKVVSSRDFRKAGSIPNDFDGAEVQYFERLGLAVVRRGNEKLRAMLQQVGGDRTVTGARPERQYRLLGTPGGPHFMTTDGKREADLAGTDKGYLRGYRDGVNQIVDHLLGGGSARERISSSQVYDETSATWGLQAIGATLSNLSGKGIRVCVLDTGFDHTHPDFSGRTVNKKLFASKSSPNDMHGHGTHCVGTSCGPRNPPRLPGYGIAYEAEIFAGKVLGDDGTGTDRSILAGIDWALEQKCDIISMSLGAPASLGDLPNDDYEQVGRVCLDAGTLIIAAAGNESARPDRINPVGSPANASTIMAVAAVDDMLQVASFSCGGLNSGQNVDLASPGVDVYSSIIGGRHGRMSGTSMATPHVTGVAALLAQSDPELRGQALWDRLVSTCRAMPFLPRDVGAGFLQLT